MATEIPSGSLLANLRRELERHPPFSQMDGAALDYFLAHAHEQYYGPGFEDTRRRVPDATRARQLLGWEPTVDLDTGLHRTLEWWKQTYS